jgi:hypothetical protein
VAIPKKGSRLSMVEGQVFRWTVRPKPTYSEGAFASPMAFAVEAAEGPGRVLHVALDRPRPDNWLLQGTSPVTPSEVERGIRHALQSGWIPTEPGPPFEMLERLQPEAAEEEVPLPLQPRFNRP